uniref:Mitochondrial fission protein ELM1 n=1 Tax=Oryza brachyantha TaxID=4533 RepID=J3LXP3_ORYBR
MRRVAKGNPKRNAKANLSHKTGSDSHACSPCLVPLLSVGLPPLESPNPTRGRGRGAAPAPPPITERPMRLPVEPMGAPEIFAGGSRGAVRRAVVIGNGCAGAEDQCLGLVRALCLADRLMLYRVIRPTGGINKWLHFLPISLHKLVDQVLRQIISSDRCATLFQGKKLAQYSVCNGQPFGLSSVLEADTKRIVTMVNDTFEKEGLALVIACGRDTISYASSIRCLAPDNVFVIQIQHPRSRLDKFDLVVLTVGALHQADSAALHTAACDWHDELANSPKPLVVVNIGGPTRNCNYDVGLAKQLIISLHNVLKTCGSVRISFSRRTPLNVSDLILKEFSSHPKVYIWDGEGPNPHLGHLAWADAFIIAADSISMLSEACSTGKPVYVVGTEHCRWKFSDFHNTLHERGAVRPFTGLEDMSENWSYPPLNDAIVVAARVREVLIERGWTVG